MTECKCKECESSRQHALEIKALKAELPKPEWDWEDLERQGREYHERVMKQRCSFPLEWRARGLRCLSSRLTKGE